MIVLEFEYEERLLAQVDATSQDIQANLYSLYTVFDNIQVRLNNVMIVLEDLEIDMIQSAQDIAADPAAQGIEGLVAFNVREKFDNFRACFRGLQNVVCKVYDLPASNVEVDLDGLQLEQPQAVSTAISMIGQLEWIGGPGATAPTTVGQGYTHHTTNKAWTSGPFQRVYRYIRDEAVAAGVITNIGDWVPCRRGLNTQVPSWSECEFTDPETFDKAVEVQLEKLRIELAVLEGTFINARQSVRAFIHDVVEALEYRQKTRDAYDPRNGNDPYDPQSRQGAQ